MKTIMTGSASAPPEDSADSLHRELEIDTLARTVWGEARGEGARGMEGVACVVVNRLRVSKREGGFWWGGSVIQICQKPYQFSCWNKDDPNCRLATTVDAADMTFATAIRIARRALLNALPDRTNGATHYHAAGVQPYWARGQKPVAVIGRHVFYRLA